MKAGGRVKPVVISASRRTDIAAFYAEWFIRRVRKGYCKVQNPFNRHQYSRVSLLPSDVLALVFWTRNARPLVPYLHELDRLGYTYYFQYTVMSNPRMLDARVPSTKVAIEAFRELAGMLEPKRVVWRYDPIVFTEAMGVEFHLDSFRRIADALSGYTERCVISVVDGYRRAASRMRNVYEREGFSPLVPKGKEWSEFFSRLREAACERGMEIVSCAEEFPLNEVGIPGGKCIDDGLLSAILGVQVKGQKDKGQREACGCIESRDVGAYDTCGMGCQYCYATASFDRARQNLRNHDPESACLVGECYDDDEVTGEGGPYQGSLL